MTDILPLYIATGIFNIIMLLFLLHLVSNNETMTGLESRAYILTIVLTISVILTEIATSIFDTQGSNFRIPNIMANEVGFTLSVYIPFVLAMLYDKELIKQLKFLLIPAHLFLLVMITSPWTGWMFSVSINNVYRRGPYFFLYIIVYLYGFILVIRANHRLSLQFIGSDKIYLSFLYVIFVFGSFVQVCYPKIHSTWHCITIVLVLFYLFQRERQFKYDVLTGVLNRSAFEIQLNKLSKANYGVILIFDLNKFKEINDTYGHQIGDDCIKAAGHVIQNSFQQIGYCYRLGGDEFCVLGQGIDESKINECIQSMLTLVKEARKEYPILPNISYGYSFYKKGVGKDILQVFEEADKRMYEYKKITEIHE